MPRIWRQVVASEVEAFRARRVASAMPFLPWRSRSGYERSTKNRSRRSWMAAALLADPTCSTEQLVAATNGPGGLSRPVQLVVHLTPETLTGDDPVATLDHCAVRTLLAQQIASWCQRETQEVRVMPVVDLATHRASRARTITGVMALRAALAQPTCAFPHCTRRSSRCDRDHLVATSRQGVTCDCNLVPLSRRHHRLKTHAGWAYRRVGPRSISGLSRTDRCSFAPQRPPLI